MENNTSANANAVRVEVQCYLSLAMPLSENAECAEYSVFEGNGYFRFDMEDVFADGAMPTCAIEYFENTSIMRLSYPNGSFEEYSISSSDDVEEVLEKMGIIPTSMIEEVPSMRRGALLERVGSCHDENGFCDWEGNPLPMLPCVEKTWDAEYMLMLTDTQKEYYDALPQNAVIAKWYNGADREYFAVRKKEIDCVEVYTSK